MQELTNGVVRDIKQMVEAVKIPLTAEQEAVVTAAIVPSDDLRVANLCVAAVAGSGKTRCLIEVVRRVVKASPRARVLFLSFERVKRSH